MNVQLGSNQRPSDLQHSTLTTALPRFIAYFKSFKFSLLETEPGNQRRRLPGTKLYRTMPFTFVLSIWSKYGFYLTILLRAVFHWCTLRYGKQGSEMGVYFRRGPTLGEHGWAFLSSGLLIRRILLGSLETCKCPMSKYFSPQRPRS